MDLVQVVVASIRYLHQELKLSLPYIEQRRKRFQKCQETVYSYNLNYNSLTNPSNRGLIVQQVIEEIHKNLLDLAESFPEAQNLVEQPLSVETFLGTEMVQQVWEQLEIAERETVAHHLDKFYQEMRHHLGQDDLAFYAWKSRKNAELAQRRRHLTHELLRLHARQQRSQTVMGDRPGDLAQIAQEMVTVALQQEVSPLTIFLPPPRLCLPTPYPEPWLGFEAMLGGAIRYLVTCYQYHQREIKLIGGFTGLNLETHGGSQSSYGEWAAQQLFPLFQAIPCVWLETEITPSFFHFWGAFWGPEFDDLNVVTLLDQIPWLPPHPPEHLKTLEAITFLHCLHLSLLLDQYFLLYAPQIHLPLLPQILPALSQRFHLGEEVAEPIQAAVWEYYHQLLDFLGQKMGDLAPPYQWQWYAQWAQAHPPGQPPHWLPCIHHWLHQRGRTVVGDPWGELRQILIPEDHLTIERLNILLRVLQLPPLDVAICCYQRGLERLDRQDYAGAKLDFDRTLSLAPHGDVYWQRAVSSYQLQQYESSLADLDQAIALQPHRRELYELQGDVLVQLHREDAAISAYQKAVSLGLVTDKHQALQDKQQRDRQRQILEKQLQKELLYAEASPLGARRKLLRLMLTTSGAEKTVLEMLWVPPGQFTSSISQFQETIVITEGFYLGKYPVTQEQWQLLMHNNPSYFHHGGQFPVENVSWNHCQDFVQRLSRKLKVNFDLPTEHQWEYACRLGPTLHLPQQYFFGDQDLRLGEYAWFKENSQNATHLVGQKKANDWGFHDLYGNVWEWCKDDLGDRNFENFTSGEDLPEDRQNHKILRGGSWNNGAGFCSSLRRLWFNHDFLSPTVGLRLLLPAKAAEQLASSPT